MKNKKFQNIMNKSKEPLSGKKGPEQKQQQQPDLFDPSESKDSQLENYKNFLRYLLSEDLDDEFTDDLEEELEGESTAKPGFGR